MALTKRIAAVPGDIVNLEELTYMASMDQPYREETILTVPEGCYFVLGDNTQNSYDSRYWEDPFVREEDIVAKLIWPSGVPISWAGKCLQGTGRGNHIGRIGF